MPKFKNDNIGFKVSQKLKNDLTIIAEYNRRTLSDFIRIELEKITESEENKEILKKHKELKEIKK